MGVIILVRALGTRKIPFITQKRGMYICKHPLNMLVLFFSCTAWVEEVEVVVGVSLAAVKCWDGNHVIPISFENRKNISGLNISPRPNAPLAVQTAMMKPASLENGGAMGQCTR